MVEEEGRTDGQGSVPKNDTLVRTYEKNIKKTLNVRDR